MIRLRRRTPPDVHALLPTGEEVDAVEVVYEGRVDGEDHYRAVFPPGSLFVGTQIEAALSPKVRLSVGEVGSAHVENLRDA